MSNRYKFDVWLFVLVVLGTVSSSLQCQAKSLSPKFGFSIFLPIVVECWREN